MPEHTIPGSLLDNIRSGRAAIIIGAGMGVPSWKQLLEKMNAALRERGEDGDEAAAKDVDKLLHKGSLVRAAGFLGRTLGGEVCDRIVAETWCSPDELPKVAQALAVLPVRQVWTTFPGDVLERAMEAELPADWPVPRIQTYREAGEVDTRRRTLLKLLGDFESFIATPMSIRKALSSADELRELVRPFYGEGSLLLIGFRYGDPDLAALLDRVFGAFEPPKSDHYMTSASVGPVTVDELAAEHHIQVINLPGRGTDEKATQALLDFLAELREACSREGISLAQTRPAADDLEGWIELLQDEPGNDEAVQAIQAIEEGAREAGDNERLIEILMARVEVEGTGAGRAALLRQVAQIFENELGDVPGAFTALTAAVREDPANFETVNDAERLAEAVDGWAELVADVSEVAGDISESDLAAEYWTRLGAWYHKHLDHHEYAVAAYREALRKSRAHVPAYLGVADVYRSQQKWAELADVLRKQLEITESAADELDLYLALGDLYETQLAQTAQAVETYKEAAELDTDVDDALLALERLYRREERWSKLAQIVERRASGFEAAGDSQRATAMRRELASLRSDKLGDVEGAIRKHEAALEQNGDDVETLRALEDLYEKAGQSEDYHRTLSRLAELVPEDERPPIYRKLAAELEEKEGGRSAAIEALEALIDIDSTAEDAYRGLERMLLADGRHDDLVGVLERHVFVTTAPAPKAELHARMGDIYEKELADPHRAIECHQDALTALDDHEASLTALARLYARTEQWANAVDVAVRHAELVADGAADRWCEAGRLAAEKLEDLESAVQYLEKALERDPGHFEAMLSLAKTHKAQGAWANAVRRLVDAVDCSANRLERIDLLGQAAELAETKLDDLGAALQHRVRLLELDPEHLETGRWVAERYLATGEHELAVPVLEMLARRAGDDRHERARREVELGRVCRDLGQGGKATLHFERAVQADPANLEAALGLAGTLFERASEGDDEELWGLVDKRYRDLLARHRTTLADSQATDVWYRLGVAARSLGEDAKASDALRRALERDPGHAPSLRVMVDVAAGRKDWKSVVKCKRELLDTTSGEARAELLESIGDVCHDELGDASAALGAYLEAVKIVPESHVLLHKALDIYTEQKQWRQAVETLDSIARTEREGRRRAKYHYAAAVIGRDELDDVELAVDYFQRALDDDPTTPKAFDAVDQLLSKRGAWKDLARAYRKMLKRIGEDAPTDVLFKLWSRLGELCVEHLDDPEAGIAAYEVAASLDPDNLERHEQLVDLYLEAGDDRRDDAVDELQILVKHTPDRVELYRALSKLYGEGGELDKAYCLAQALVFLGAASDAERALYEQHRPEQFVLAKRRLTEELWQKAIVHDRENRHIGAIFSSMVGPIAATTAQPASAFDIAAQGLDDSRPVSKVFKYATSVLGLAPEPQMAMATDGDGLRVANIAEGGKLAPRVVVGSPHVDKSNQRELAFELGKRLAYFRPERFVRYALPTPAKLEGAFYAALAAAGVEVPGSHGDAEKLAAHLKQTVPSAVLEQVGSVAGKMGLDEKNGVIAGWSSAADLTANRVGLILCNDLETAAKLVATEASVQSSISAKDRLRDLLAYSVSEDYFAVRRHLGLGVEG